MQLRDFWAATRRRYSPEDKARAVRQIRQLRKQLGTPQGTIKRVGQQMGCGKESLRTWVKQADIDEGVEPGVTNAEAKRIRELEQENRELRRANDLLKRASAFFAAELDRPSKRSLGSSTTTVPGSGSSSSAGTCRWPPAPTTPRRSGRSHRPHAPCVTR